MDGTELLMRDHREAEHLFAKLPAQTTAAERRTTAELLIRLLSQHDAAEVQVLYPTLRRIGEAGERLGKHSLDEHRSQRDLLHELDKHLDDVMDDSFVATWQTLSGMVAEHVHEEESETFPLLRGVLSAHDLDELGKRIEKGKQLAPTHPHPTTPDNPVGATVMGMAASVADRARDRKASRRER